MANKIDYRTNIKNVYATADTGEGKILSSEQLMKEEKWLGRSTLI